MSADHPYTPLLTELEQLPDSFPWKACLRELAGTLAERLRGLAHGPQRPHPGTPALLRRLELSFDSHLASWPAAGTGVLRQHRLRYHDGSPRRTRNAPGAWSLPLPGTAAGQLLRPLPGPAQAVVLLALAPHLVPGFLDRLVQEFVPAQGELPEIGGVRGSQHRALLPTGETALFLLAGTRLPARQAALRAVWGPAQPLARAGLLSLAEVPAGEPRLSGRLVLAGPALELLVAGHAAGPPAFGPDFPAQRLHTPLSWADLVLPAATRALVDDVTHWVQHHEALRQHWGLGRHLKPGYRALFYGPSGTGKTLTATLLGKHTGREVYRVDLSLVTSKYIGETEKNLGRLFDRAHAQGWILFFDEADALFGKRTDTQNSHDRFANQEVAFLLQKVEDYDGLVILASNLRGNLDPAFSRRFQAMIPFALPSPAERRDLWERTLPPQAARRAPDLRPEQLAARYELSGAAILNVVQFAILRALGRGQELITTADLTEGIRLEYQKDGKLL